MITQSFSQTGSCQRPVPHPPTRRRRWLPAAALSLIFLTHGGMPPPASGQQPDADEPQGVEVLTRGPVHEAFAGVISNNVEPAVTVPKAPPEAIEEIPPDQRPEGTNVTWIPGYWAWDDERNDFLWISGIWRDVPPDREWRVGYWTEVSGGWQWISGYWADVSTVETTYLPAPPPTIEEGPNIDPPSDDYTWTPGYWAWRETRYAWSPGYWAKCRPDWDWNPPHYTWTPGGYVFVDGYWDHAVSRRGVVFAPVYFDAGIRARPSYSWSPSIAISVGMISSNLFLRPRYDHYYFGDYYDRRYAGQGFVSSFNWQSSRRGYDPFYARQRWEHRQDKDWDRNFRASFDRLRDDVQARPPRTWRDGRLRFANGGEDGRDQDRDHPRFAGRFADWVKRPGGNLRFQSIAQTDREQYQRLGRELQKSRQERRDLEGQQRGPGKDGKKEPFRAKAEKSFIAAKAGSEGPAGRMPPPRPGNTGRPDPRGSKDRPDNNRDANQVPRDGRLPSLPDDRDGKGNKGQDRDQDGKNNPDGRDKKNIPGPNITKDPRSSHDDQNRPANPPDGKDKNDKNDRDRSPRNPSSNKDQPDPRRAPETKPENRDPGRDRNKDQPSGSGGKRSDSDSKDARQPNRTTPEKPGRQDKPDRPDNPKPSDPRKDTGKSRDPRASGEGSPRKEQSDKPRQSKESKDSKPESRPRQPQPEQKAARPESRPQPDARPKNNSPSKPRGESPKPQQKKESAPQPRANPQPKPQNPSPPQKPGGAEPRGGGGPQKGKDGKGGGGDSDDRRKKK